jgi:hypothetical protein
VDLACLVNVEELETDGLILKGYHQLANLKKASFQSCEFLDKDICCFRMVSSLTLSGIRTTMDISPMSEVPTLNLADCKKLSGLISLGNSRELLIEHCGYVTHLRNVAKLHNFTGNFSPLQNVIVPTVLQTSVVWQNRQSET